MILILDLFHFKGVIKVNYLVDELFRLTLIFQLDSVPKLKISMENSELLQLQDPIQHARNPGEQLLLPLFHKILDVLFTAVPKLKIFHSHFKSEEKTFAIFYCILSN